MPTAQDAPAPSVLLLAGLPGGLGWVVAERAAVSRLPSNQIQNRRGGAPAQSSEAPVACSEWGAVNRRPAERLWGRLKGWWVVATRYERAAQTSTAYPACKPW